MTNNPKQSDAFNCGIWVGLAAEIFCTNAQGRFHINNSGGSALLTCEGSNPDFLQKDQTWCTDDDVVSARLMCQAAAAAYYVAANPEECPAMDMLCRQAQGRLQRCMKIKSTGMNLWYAPTVNYFCQVS